jgi:hypothetical protein
MYLGKVRPREGRLRLLMDLWELGHEPVSVCPLKSLEQGQRVIRVCHGAK